MLFALVVERHFAIPPGPVHRIDVGVEKHLVKVPHNDRQGRQDSFLKVNGRGYVQPPACQKDATQTLAHNMIPVAAITTSLHTSAQYSAFSA